MHYIYYLDKEQTKNICGYVADNDVSHRLVAILPPTEMKHCQPCTQLPKIIYTPILSQSQEMDDIDGNADQVLVMVDATAKASFNLVGQLGCGFCLTNTGAGKESARVTLQGKVCIEREEVSKLVDKEQQNTEAIFNALPGGKVELILNEGTVGLVTLLPKIFGLLTDPSKVKMTCKRNNVAFELPKCLPSVLPVKKEKPKSRIKKTGKRELSEKEKKDKKLKDKFNHRSSVDTNVRKAKSAFQIRSRSRDGSDSRSKSSPAGKKPIKLRSPKNSPRVKRSGKKESKVVKVSTMKSKDVTAEEKDDVDISLKLTNYPSDKSLSDILADLASKAMVEEKVDAPGSGHISSADKRHWVLYYKLASAKINRPVGVCASARIGWTPEKPLPREWRLNDGRLNFQSKDASNANDFESVLRGKKLVTINAVGAAAVVRIYGENGSGYAISRGGSFQLNGRLVVTRDLNKWKVNSTNVDDSKCRVEALWGRLKVYICDQDIILLVADKSESNYRIISETKQ